MAPYLPLVLQDCAFENLELFSMPDSLDHVLSHLKRMWNDATMRQALLKNTINSVEELIVGRELAITQLANPKQRHMKKVHYPEESERGCTKPTTYCQFKVFA